MTTNQLLLIQLAEECSEVAERVSKALRFGLGEVQPGQPHTNAERVRLEMIDLVTVYAMLSARGVLPQLDGPDAGELNAAKMRKVNAFMDVSAACGVLTEGDQ